MLLFERFEPLPHISIDREPYAAEIRPRVFPRPRVQPRTDRRQHGEDLRRQTIGIAEQVSRRRSDLGVEPHRFLVLRLETLDVDQREAIERMNVDVVEELLEKRAGRSVYRLLVQFRDDEALATFVAEYDNYGTELSDSTALPAGMRRDLFDSLDSVSTVGLEERMGGRLKREGEPKEGRFYLDVDLWSPESASDRRELVASFSEFVRARGGRVVHDPLMIPSLILVKVESNVELLRALSELDLVSLVDLPPVSSPEESFDLRVPVVVPESLPAVPPGRPTACVVDSGVVSGHPLLQGVVVEAADFESGESTAADLVGHGTLVSGLVVYGDVARRMQGNEWRPQVGLYSAKVLRRELNPVDPSNPDAMFPIEERVEWQLKNAIEYFCVQYGCRIFNLSIGNTDRVYAGGRQWPWAALLDELTRRLDILIVVSAGNVSNPDIPSALRSDQFQREVLRQLQEDKHRLIDPATAALCLTVGAVSRRDDVLASTASGTQLAATPKGCPSAFTRCGPGVANAIKPEVVAPGGNYAVVSSLGSKRWIKQNWHLAEPTLNMDYTTGRQLRSVSGTSFAAAHVTHIAARMEAALRDQFGAPPSQNVIRALLVSSASVDPSVRKFIGRQAEVLRTVGYGQPNTEYCSSAPNRVCLVAEDHVEHRMFHVYSLVVPHDFLTERGQRAISVSLAYDPPTRLSRRDYISTAMWLEIFGGLTTEQIVEFRSKYSGDGEPPKAPDRNVLQFKPGGQTVRMSTVQKRSWHSNRGTFFLNRPDPEGDASLHIFVGCQRRFRHPEDGDGQKYALVVSLWHDSERIDIYQQVRATVRARARIGMAR